MHIAIDSNIFRTVADAQKLCDFTRESECVGKDCRRTSALCVCVCVLDSETLRVCVCACVCLCM
jgi:hypothetical protein